MTRLGRWLARLRPRPLLERAVLVELEIAVYPDYTVRVNEVNGPPLPPEQVTEAAAAMTRAIAYWAHRHGGGRRARG